MKYSIGQNLWHATAYVEKVYLTCPDCGGTGRIRCIMHDETIMSIGCGNCALGYGPPTGRIGAYQRKPKATPVTVIGLEARAGEAVKYQVTDCYSVGEEHLFEQEDEAISAAKVLAEEYNRGELDRIQNKEKDTRTWAWNASYHRKAIKEAKKQIAYHEAKLNVAAIKAKEPTSGDSP